MPLHHCILTPAGFEAIATALALQQEKFSNGMHRRLTVASLAHHALISQDTAKLLMNRQPRVKETTIQEVFRNLDLPTPVYGIHYYHADRRGWLSRNIPPSNPFFTGRQDVLQQLHRTLSLGDTALVAVPQALAGLGGIGKTHTALAYAYRYRRDYQGIYWVNAETPASLASGLVSLAPELAPPLVVSDNQEATLQAVKDWFGSEADWLLILDNADTLDILAEHFPPHHNGRLLLTTRANATSMIAARIELEKFSPTDGATLLLRRAGKITPQQEMQDAKEADRQAAMTISEAVDGLPLALEQAGAYIEATRCSVSEYLTLFHASGLTLLESGATPDQRSVAITFSLSLEQVRAQPGGEAAVQFLSICAFLAPDAIPEEIFTSGAFILPVCPTPYSARNYVCLRGAALAYSLLSRDEAHKTLSMHRLVQAVIQQGMTDAEERQWATRAVEAVATFVQQHEPTFENLPLCDRLLPHWRVCAERINQKSLYSADAALLFRQVGRYLSNRAQYTEAEWFSRLAVQWCEEVFGMGDARTAFALDNLSMLYNRQGRWREAERSALAALTIYQQAHNASHPNALYSMQSLAITYTEQQRCEEAIHLLKQPLAAWEKTLPETASPLATSLHQMGQALTRAGAYVEAEPHYLRALQLSEEVDGPDHVNTAFYLNSLARLRCLQERYEQAERLFVRARKINEEHLMPGHPNLGLSLWGLAVCYWKQGHTSKAETLFLEARDILETSFGAQHGYFCTSPTRVKSPFTAIKFRCPSSEHGQK